MFFICSHFSLTSDIGEFKYNTKKIRLFPQGRLYSENFRHGTLFVQFFDIDFDHGMWRWVLVVLTLFFVEVQQISDSLWYFIKKIYLRM